MWLRYVPSVQWLAGYRIGWLAGDIVAGITLAAYAIPVSLAYAALAGLPPQVGIYGYLLGGLGYALLGSSRQLAVGPTSAISLMIASTVGAMAEGDAQRYAQIATLAGFTVAILCLIAWLLRLSMLVRLVSDSILVGFKAGAGLTIIMTQLPSLFGIAGGGHNFFERVAVWAGQLRATSPPCTCHWYRSHPAAPVGRSLSAGTAGALLPLWRCRLSQHWRLGFPRWVCPRREDPAGLPSLEGPALRLRDIEEIVPLAAGCLLLAYIEGVSAARTFAGKHGYNLDLRQEFLGLGEANLAAAFGHGYPVAGGLSQTAVNDKAGARTSLALVFASITLAFCLLFLTDLLENLPKVVLAAVVLVAVYRLIDFRTMARMWRIESNRLLRPYDSAMGVCCCLASCKESLWLRWPPFSCCWHAHRPHMWRSSAVPWTAASPIQPGTPTTRSCRTPSLSVLKPLCFPSTPTPFLKPCCSVSEQVIHPKFASLSADVLASPHIDLAGSRMLHRFHDELTRLDIRLRIVAARRRSVRFLYL